MKLHNKIPRKIRQFLYNLLDPIYPYWITTTGEMILNPKFWEGREGEQWMAGRVEVYKDGPYAEYEIRYFTDKKEWADFVNKRQFGRYSKKGLLKLEKWIKDNFNHPPNWK